MRILLYLTLGLTIGGLSGMLGIGGGVLLLPALVWLFDLKQPQAAGVTLAVLAVPVTLPGVLRYYQDGVIHGEQVQMAAWIAAAFAVGTYLGASVHAYVPAPFLRVGFGLLMIYIAVRFILGSHGEVAVAAAGLASMSIAMLAYLGLRALGRRYLTRPELGQHMTKAQQQGLGDIEYHI